MNNILGQKNEVNSCDGVVNFQGKNTGNIVIGTQIIGNNEKGKEIKYELSRGKLSINREFIAATGGLSTLVGLIGIVSGLITIFQCLGSLSVPQSSTLHFILIFLGIFGIPLLVFNHKLKQKRIISVFPKSLFSFNIGLFKDGKVARLILKSKCPVKNCGGKLRFLNLDNDKYYFICSRNGSQHKYEFDFTKLDY